MNLTVFRQNPSPFQIRSRSIPTQKYLVIYELSFGEISIVNDKKKRFRTRKIEYYLYTFFRNVSEGVVKYLEPLVW